MRPAGCNKHGRAAIVVVLLCRKCNVQWPGNDNLPIDLQTDWAHPHIDTSTPYCIPHTLLHIIRIHCLLGLEFASFAFRFRFSRARRIIICELVCVLVFLFFLLLSFFRACIFCITGFTALCCELWLIVSCVVGTHTRCCDFQKLSLFINLFSPLAATIIIIVNFAWLYRKGAAKRG